MSKSEEELIASILINTKRKKRLSNLVQIAEEIRELKNKLGSIENVAKKIGISKDMINQFLNVFKINPQIRELVKERKIDSVSFVKHINRFAEEDQSILVNEFISGNINSQEIRALGPLRAKFPEISIQELINKLKKSKNIKVSVAYFQIPSKNINEKDFIKNVLKIIGNENLVSFERTGLLGKLKITSEGEIMLRVAAKKKKLTLKNFIQILFNK